MIKYASTEIKDKWGAITDAALREPVAITKRGRPSLVMMSSRDYEELQRLHLEELKGKVREGVEAADRGEFSERSILDIKVEARRRAVRGS